MANAFQGAKGFNPGFGQPMISDEFNQMCTEARVEARVQPMPNPGDPMTSMRLITFTNYNNLDSVTITESSGKKHIIGPKGTLQIMVSPKQPLPNIVKGLPNDNV